MSSISSIFNDFVNWFNQFVPSCSHLCHRVARLFGDMGSNAPEVLSKSLKEKSVTVLTQRDNDLEVDRELISKMGKTFALAEAVFFKLDSYLQETEETLTDEKSLIVLSLADQVESQFGKFVENHIKWMGSGHPMLQNTLDLYQSKPALEKKCIYLHEFFESFSFKVDGGIDFYAKYSRDKFLDAHQKAVKIENIYMLAIANQLKCPLTLKALNYLRLVDEGDLSQIVYTPFSGLGHKEIIKVLISRQDIKPTFQELEDYVNFMKMSGISSKSPETIHRMVWYKVFFTELHKIYNEDKHTQVLHTFITILLFDDNYNKFKPEELFSALKSFIPHIKEEIVYLLKITGIIFVVI